MWPEEFGTDDAATKSAEPKLDLRKVGVDASSSVRRNISLVHDTRPPLYSGMRKRDGPDGDGDDSMTGFAC